jgi:hypothetical protein
MYHFDLRNHRLSIYGCLRARAHADVAFCRFHHYIYSDHLLLIKHQRSEGVFVRMHDALLLVCVCVCARVIQVCRSDGEQSTCTM